MARILFRVAYGVLLVAIFLGGAWVAFQRSIVGRSVTVPDLTGKTVLDAIRVAHDAGLKVEDQSTRARNDDKVPRDRILAQDPEAGSLAKPAQVVRVVVSLGAKQTKVPELAGLPGRRRGLVRIPPAQVSRGIGTRRRAWGSWPRIGTISRRPNSAVDV